MAHFRTLLDGRKVFGRTKAEWFQINKTVGFSLPYKTREEVETYLRGRGLCLDDAVGLSGGRCMVVWDPNDPRNQQGKEEEVTPLHTVGSYKVWVRDGDFAITESDERPDPIVLVPNNRLGADRLACTIAHGLDDGSLWEVKN